MKKKKRFDDLKRAYRERSDPYITFIKPGGLPPEGTSRSKTVLRKQLQEIEQNEHPPSKEPTVN